ncbi:hypothetical protein KCP71_24200 [Salmonella enterica subsp. enterica]|nr:hypothetical protein KCP71_24200 [Salmonella enterica subsp. enterica]
MNSFSLPNGIFVQAHRELTPDQSARAISRAELYCPSASSRVRSGSGYFQLTRSQRNFISPTKASRLPAAKSAIATQASCRCRLMPRMATEDRYLHSRRGTSARSL